MHVDRFDAAVGVLYFNTFAGLTDGDFDGLGVLYGNATYGTDAAAGTAGIGWGFAGSEIADHPIVQFGGHANVVRGVDLVSENWIVTGSDLVLLSLGLRVGSWDTTLDLSATLPAGVSGETSPWLSFTVAHSFRIGP